MRVAIYARVSTKDKGQEVDNQLRVLRKYCDQPGWTITGEYIDHEKGSKEDRREFLSLFADASRRKFELVLFWALDRFTREGVLKTLQYLEKLTSYGVDYRSYTEQHFDSCGMFKEVVIALFAMMAKQERQRISERTKAGLDRARANGVKLGRRRVAVDQYRMVTLLAQGRTQREIAKELGISCGTLSRQLKLLPQKGVCKTAKTGRAVSVT
jgi:DNA invertase Pin-like site-specific DNA recombinase